MLKVCGNCKHCIDNNICNGDSLCTVKDLEVSRGDDIRYYGESENQPCSLYASKSCKLRLTYYLPNQSRLFSDPKTFETDDMREWADAINTAHKNEYEIVKIERIFS